MLLRSFLAGVVLLALNWSAATGQSKAPGKVKGKKEIAITFDELPAAKSFGEVDLEAINYLILDALKRHNVKATGFVVGQDIDNSFDILGRWLNEGHKLGSMTYSNQDYNYISTEQFLDDIARGLDAIEPMLSGFGQKRRYFRYPYLHYGTTVPEKEEVAVFLADRDIVVAHATTVPEDYLYNLTLGKLGKHPDSARFDELMNEYVNHVLDQVERVEQLSLELENRLVPQILLLRANRLNAVYLDDLLTALEGEGYKYVTLDDALADPVFTRGEAYYDMKGVGYLDMIYMSNPDLLPAE
jgi:peptidoglycan/xylan/chitin deacetylase (PgdA/CDA1 family)